MFRVYPYIFILFCLACAGSLSSNIEDKGFNKVRYRCDTVVSADLQAQIVHSLVIPRNSAFKLILVQEDTLLRPTSVMVYGVKALAAVNGGFFNTIRGGSVSYMEKNDTVLSGYDQGAQSVSPNKIFTGAIIVDDDEKINIETAQEYVRYAQSPDEQFVLVSGPILIENTLKSPLPESAFTHTRHPRSCMALSDGYIYFITVDGRSQQSSGMSLPELQSYLEDLNVQAAINLAEEVLARSGSHEEVSSINLVIKLENGWWTTF